MNIKEYKNQLKLELNEYKDKLKEKLNEYKEKLNLKLKKFKEREYKKKNKKSKKTKRKGGAFDFSKLEEYLKQLEDYLESESALKINIENGSNSNPNIDTIKDKIKELTKLREDKDCDNLIKELMELLKLTLESLNQIISFNLFMDLINILNELLTSNNCDKITLFDFLCYINNVDKNDNNYNDLKDSLNNISLKGSVINSIIQDFLNKLKQDDNITIISIIDYLKK